MMHKLLCGTLSTHQGGRGAPPPPTWGVRWHLSTCSALAGTPIVLFCTVDNNEVAGIEGTTDGMFIPKQRGSRGLLCLTRLQQEESPGQITPLPTTLARCCTHLSPLQQCILWKQEKNKTQQTSPCQHSPDSVLQCQRSCAHMDHSTASNSSTYVVCGSLRCAERPGEKTGGQTQHAQQEAHGLPYRCSQKTQISLAPTPATI